MSNIDAFNEIAARVLEHLYATFPQGARLLAADFVGEADRNAVMNFHYTVRFLGAEGLLKYDVASDDGEVFFEVILTGRGLAALNAVPDPQKERLSFRQKLSAALESGYKEALGSSVNEFVTVVATGRTNFMG